jgi:zinc protease
MTRSMNSMKMRPLALLATMTVIAPALGAQPGPRPAPQIVAQQPGLAPVRPYTLPPVDDFRLANGLRVVAVRQSAVPLVTARLILDAGAEHEPAAKNGVATLVTSLLPEGTAEIPGPELAERMERLGAQFQTAAGQNSALVAVTALKPVFGEALGLAAQAAMAPAFPERDFERVRQQGITAHVQAQSTVEGLANETFARAVFAPQAPYSRPASGTAASLQSITREDALQWHRAMYVPGNATLLLVGDLTTDEARRLAEQAFGSWRGTVVPRPRPANSARPVSATRVILVDRPGSVQSAIRIGQASVGPEDADYLRLTALTQILGGAFNARINQNLRERHGWTYGAFASYNPFRGAGTLFINSSVRTNATDSAVAESVREYRRIVDEAVPAEELASAAGNLAGSFPASVQTVQGLASRMQSLLVWGLPLDFYATYGPRLTAFTPADIATVGRGKLTPAALTVVVAGDLASIEAPIRALNLGQVEVWSPSGERIR